MHQSKKEILSRQWNQIMSQDFMDQIEKDEVDINELFSREIAQLNETFPPIKR